METTNTPGPLEWDLAAGPRAIQLRIRDWAGPEPTVVLLHGFLEQSAAWDPVARSLGRRVVAPNQRGHGRSGHVGDGGWYHFWDYVGDLDQLVEHIGGPIDLVGHSMGGTVAALYAGTRPDMVRRLVLVEGLGRNPLQERDRVVIDLGPERRVQITEQVGGLVIPAPPQVLRETP